MLGFFFGIGPLELLILSVIVGIPVLSALVIVIVFVLLPRKPRGPED